MSIDSPTLRSSSSTAPGPSFRSSPTSILARPSTAETCTGTSKTASRSAALRVVSPSSINSAGCISAVTETSPSRFGSGTFDSWSLIARHLSRPSGLAVTADPDVGRNPFPPCALRPGAVADPPAVCPLEPAVARRNVRFGKNDEPAFEPAHAGDLFQALARFGIERVVEAHDHVGRGHQLVEAVGRQRGDPGERLARDQL